MPGQSTRLAGVVLAFALALPAGLARSEHDTSLDAESHLRSAVTEFAEKAFEIRLRADPALASAAREHSEVLSTGARLDTHQFLRQSLSLHGVLDPFPYVFYGSGPAAGLDEIERRLLQHLSRIPAVERRLYTHVGVGMRSRTRRRFLLRRQEWFVTVLLTQRAVSFSPIPDDLRPGDRFLFEGELHPPFREPEVLLTRPDGNTDELENYAVDPRHFRTYVHFRELPGEYQLEVMGRYDMGPRVLGLCSLYPRQPGTTLPYQRILHAARQGTLEPSKPLPEPELPRTEREAEATLLRLLNRDRDRAGLPVLVELPQLSALARSHSADMRDRRFFAHVSPTTGRLVNRAAEARIRYRRLGENIAIGHDVHEAEEALMRSPGHRMNLLDPHFTHVGVGVVFDVDAQGKRRVYVTQNFMIPAR
ncbi:MAG: CAP domain-containing protein [Candidatus Krumholzibacteriia bacterium]